MESTGDSSLKFTMDAVLYNVQVMAQGQELVESHMSFMVYAWSRYIHLRMCYVLLLSLNRLHIGGVGG